MNILLINGSPKGKASNSLRLAKSFIEGVSEQHANEDVTVEQLNVATMDIKPCKGCFHCWKNTPGKCIMSDDEEAVIQKQLWADLVIWSFPLYYFNVPGLLKNLIDRQLPMSLPFMSDANRGYGSGAHESRYDMTGKKHVLISTCGFYSSEGNYDSVTKMFDHILGKGNYESIFCGQGELFRVKELSARTDQYLALVKKAGIEYAQGGISDQTKAELKVLLYPKDMFEQMADASWGISRDTSAQDSKNAGEKPVEQVPFDHIFTSQMAALYDKTAYDGKDRVLEMNYTDLGRSYQILLGKDGSKVFTDGSLTTTTKLNTPFEVWQSISRGEISGPEALGKHLYTVEGDFSFMIDWDKYFGPTPGSSTEAAQDAPAKEAGNAQKNPQMITMLLPWITFWTATSFDSQVGAMIVLLVTALMPLIMRNFKFTIWDRISFALVGALSAGVFMSGNGDSNLIVNLGYLAFGLMWLASCLTKEPLCAAYVKYSYGGDSAYSNPLFMKTNYILAACWGAMYVLTAIWSWFAVQNGVGGILVIVNNLVPIGMGLFTAWFQKWYPAKMASGK